MTLLRRLTLLVLGVAVTVYVLAISVHVRSVRELGIECLLSESGARGPRLGSVRLSPKTDIVGDAPRVGDYLSELAGNQTLSWVHFKRRLAELDVVSTLDKGIAVPTVTEPSELARVTGNVAQLGNERWVRVAFRRDKADSEDRAVPGGPVPNDHELTAWLRLRPITVAGLVLLCVWMVLETSLLALGIVVVARRPGDPSAATFCAFCAASVVTFLGLFHWTSVVGVPWLILPLVFCSLLLAPLVLHLYLLFPRPLAQVRRWPRLVLVAVYGPALVFIAFVFWNLASIDRGYRDGVGAAAINAQLHVLSQQIYLGLVLSLIWFAAGIAVLVVRFRLGRRGAQRRQVGWLLGGALATLPPIAYLAWLGITDRAALAFGGSSQAMLCLICLTLAGTHARGLTRYKLVSLRGFTIRGLWYLAIIGAATALYCLFIELFAPLAGRTHFHWLDAFVAAVTALTLIVLLGWFRDRYRRDWDRRYVLYKHQLDKAVRRLSAAVDQLVEASQLAKQMLQSARDVVAAERGAVYLRDATGTQLELAARVAWPDAPELLQSASPLTHELRHTGIVSARLGLGPLPSAAQLELRDLEGELAFALEREGLLVGLLILGPKADGTPYSIEERNFLVALARTTTLALRGAEANRTIGGLKEDLHAKVTKIAEQQKRITFLQGELLSRGPTQRRTPAASQFETSPVPMPVDSIAPEIRGSSPAVRQMLDQVRKIAASPSSVLIRGESGTGKELLALAIHRNSPRAQGPFVAVHCAALSPGLLEAELFGHVKGAYTGADRDRPGRFELAHGGTLLLDEIGDIALDTQVKLLRVLQERAFERVGSSNQVQVDVRLIAATHQDLEALIRRGQFREDLYYRLNVISVRCPPLRERREDIFELAVGFLEDHASRAGKHLVRIDEEALDVLAAYKWPGNIRQLENTIERAVVLAEGESITLEDLPPELSAQFGFDRRDARRRLARVSAAEATGRHNGTAAPVVAADNLEGELANIERDRLIEVLAECGGNKSLAARRLGIPRSTLFSKLARLGLATR